MTSCHWPYDDPNNENQNRTITNVDLLCLHVNKLGHNLHTSRRQRFKLILLCVLLVWLGFTWLYTFLLDTLCRLTWRGAWTDWKGRYRYRGCFSGSTVFIISTARFPMSSWKASVWKQAYESNVYQNEVAWTRHVT